MSGYKAHKKHKQSPFLAAYAICGKISEACKRARISPDAIHDWRRKDPAFNRAFVRAKSNHLEKRISTIDRATFLLTSAIKPYVPETQWPQVCVKLTGAVIHFFSTTEFKEAGLSTDPSRAPFELLSSSSSHVVSASACSGGRSSFVCQV